MTPDGRLDPVELGLPHREPFLFVDAITELAEGERAVGEKTFHADDPVFRGHFPGQPMVPGVLLAEALAQTAGLAIGATGGRMLYLTAIRNMKFPASCVPGERIVLTATRTGGVGELIQCDVTARVGDRLVAEGSIVLSSRSSAP